MKNSIYYKSKNIRSLHDLQMEKARLQMELVKREEKIKRNYQNLVDAFTFRNILKNITDEITMTSSAVSTAFSVGKYILDAFKRRKRNKEKKHSESIPAPDDIIHKEQ